MAAPRAQYVPSPYRWLYRLCAVLLTIILAIFIVFFGVSMIAKSLGAAVILLPSLVLGFAALILAIRWRGSMIRSTGRIVLSTLVVAFLVACTLSFHILWKYVQPSVLPKQSVSIGMPWVIEGNIFKNNDYNNPVVIQLANGDYRMYFHDHNDNMYSALSDDGTHFKLEGIRFKGEMPTIVQLDRSRWRMYYIFRGDGPNAKGVLKSAVSTDGLHWTQDPGTRLSPGGKYDPTMIHPTVIQLPNGTYKLYYDGETPETSSLALSTKFRKILSATSKDGLNWTKDPGYRLDEKPLHTWEAYSPKAMYEDGQVVLHFTTPNGIYEAVSNDGLHFAVSKNPVFGPDKRLPMPDGDNGVIGSYQDAFIMNVDGGKRMYFWINGQGIFSAFEDGN